jgi:hypothetical protein
VDLESLVSNSDERLNQNVLRNLLSRSEVMVCGIQKWTHTHLKKSMAIFAAMMFLLEAVIMAIFQN